MLARHVPRGACKAILTGEHAVVYGHEALATALPLGFAATLDHPPQGPLLAVEVAATSAEAVPFRGALGDGSMLGQAIEKIAAVLGVTRKRPLLVRVVGDVPLGRGLGSSAALAAVIADALAVAHGLELPVDELARAARAGDEVFHGRASGIDAEAAVRRELGLFSRAAGWRRVAAAPLHLLVVDSGEPRSTADVVARVGARRAADELGVARLMAAMGALAQPAAAAASAGDLAALGRVFDDNHRLLQELGVSTPGLDAAVGAAREAGALGAKLTGAGGGGVAIALMADRAAMTRAHATLVASGRKGWALTCP